MGVQHANGSCHAILSPQFKGLQVHNVDPELSEAVMKLFHLAKSAAGNKTEIRIETFPPFPLLYHSGIHHKFIVPCREVEDVQGGWGGWPAGNGKKLSSSQAQLGQATCLAVV